MSNAFLHKSMILSGDVKGSLRATCIRVRPMRLVTWRRAAMHHGPFNETSDLATEEEILIWLTNEQLPKLIVRIRSNTEREEIIKPTCHRDLHRNCYY